MDALGDFLKEERTKLNISLEDISEETNIPVKYLEAIERDEYSVFPGEAYLKGFLRTYAKAINLDPDEIVNRYDRIKIAEAPIPIEKLIPKPPSPWKKKLLFVSFVTLFLIALFTSIFFLINNRKDENVVVKKEKKVKPSKDADTKTFEVTDKDQKKTFEVKSKNNLVVKVGDKKVTYLVKQVTPYVIITDFNGEDHILFQDKAKEFDINADGINDFYMLLNYWNKESANLTLALAETGKEDLSKFNEDVANIESLYKSNSLQNISINIKVNTPTFLRYKVDESSPVEKFYSANTILPIEIKERLFIWLSNAQAVTVELKSISKEYIPGNAGEVAVKLFEWQKMGDAEYQFVAKSLN